MSLKSCLSALLVSISLIAVVPALAADNSQSQSSDHQAHVHLQLIRNATLKVGIGEAVFLVDPMLASKGRYPGFAGTHRSELRNPLVDLPFPVETVLDDVDAVIVTHTHLDHWDDAAQQSLPKTIPLFTQNEADAARIREQGFSDVRVLSDNTEFMGVTLHKTGGQHGSDALFAVPQLAERMGSIMGVVFQAPGYKTLYVAGDTVWRDEVDEALTQFQPEVIVLNAGAAEVSAFKDDPIIMGKADVARAWATASDATIVAVHLDAINHMTLSRRELASYLAEQGIDDRVLIPEDGERARF